MKYRHLPHPVAARQHVAKRMFDRYGIAITAEEFHALCATCRNAPHITRGRSGNEVHLLCLRDKKIVAIFDRQLDTIVTVLPRGAQELMERAS